MNFLKSVKRQSLNRSQRKKARNGFYGHVYGPYESLPDNIFRYDTLYAPNGKTYSQYKTPTAFFRKKSRRIKRYVTYGMLRLNSGNLGIFDPTESISNLDRSVCRASEIIPNDIKQVAIL